MEFGLRTYFTQCQALQTWRQPHCIRLPQLVLRYSQDQNKRDWEQMRLLLNVQFPGQQVEWKGSPFRKDDRGYISFPGCALLYRFGWTWKIFFLQNLPREDEFVLWEFLCRCG